MCVCPDKQEQLLLFIILVPNNEQRKTPAVNKQCSSQYLNTTQMILEDIIPDETPVKYNN